MSELKQQIAEILRTTPYGNGVMGPLNRIMKAVAEDSNKSFRSGYKQGWTDKERLNELNVTLERLSEMDIILGFPSTTVAEYKRAIRARKRSLKKVSQEKSNG